MHIRFATENDIATLKEIIVSHYTLADAALAEKELHAMFDNQVLQPLYLVAEDQGQIL